MSSAPAWGSPDASAPRLALVDHDRVVGELYDGRIDIEPGIGCDVADDDLVQRLEVIRVIRVIGGTPAAVGGRQLANDPVPDAYL